MVLAFSVLFSIKETIKDIRGGNNYCALTAMINLGSYYNTLNGHRLGLCDHCKFCYKEDSADNPYKYMCLRRKVNKYVAS